MADCDDNLENTIKLLKQTTIQVFVDEALPDILAVTYEYGLKLFRGVLLDATKRGLPCGIQSLNPAFTTKPPNPNKSSSSAKPDDDTLYSVNQRFAYLDPANQSKRKFPLHHARGAANNRNKGASTKHHQVNKMTVRLRPRKVLCSKCKGICNENSESVQTRRKRKLSENSTPPPVVLPAPPPPNKRSLNAPITRSVVYYNKLLQPTLVPKLTRLTPQEEQAASNGASYIERIKKEAAAAAANNNKKHDCDEDASDIIRIENDGVLDTQRILRKKRSLIGSMEDLWDESVFEEGANNSKNNNLKGTAAPTNNNNIVATRTIKISYGPQGEGTVLKIPAQPPLPTQQKQIENREDIIISGGGDDDSGENLDTNSESATNNNNNDNNKAARKAMKRAKRQAKQRAQQVVRRMSPSSSSCYLGGGASTSTIGGSCSPRYTVGCPSPRHGMGGGTTSPRYVTCASHDINHVLLQQMPGVGRRRKHKMKHKKRHHRDERDRKHQNCMNNKEGEVSSTQDDSKDEQHNSNNTSTAATTTTTTTTTTQKLSINLKRLNDTYHRSCAVSVAPSDKIGRETSTSSSSDEQLLTSSERQLLPNFPPPPNPSLLVLRRNSVQSTVTSAPAAAAATASALDAGNRILLSVGDVVWGNIDGCSWWPGKILTITTCGRPEDEQRPQALVAWYGSTASSLMDFDQLCPFLDTFKLKYNKKKRGDPYKDAIKQATLEAKENSSTVVRQPLGSSPSSHNIKAAAVTPPPQQVVVVVPTALASPREIDVAS